MDEVNFSRISQKCTPLRALQNVSQSLRRHGWLNVMITNQSGIGRGLFTVDEYDAVNAELFRQFGGAIDATYFCPDHPDKRNCTTETGHRDGRGSKARLRIAIDESWFIGDKDSDILCGRNAGCRTILVLTGYGPNHRDCSPHFVARDIVEAAQIILGETK